MADIDALNGTAEKIIADADALPLTIEYHGQTYVHNPRAMSVQQHRQQVARLNTTIGELQAQVNGLREELAEAKRQLHEWQFSRRLEAGKIIEAMTPEDVVGLIAARLDVDIVDML